MSDDIESRIARYRERMEEIIRTHGFMVQAVFPVEGEEPGIHFAYSIGLHDLGLPELLALGLPGQVAHALITDVAAHLRQVGMEQVDLDGHFEHPRWPSKFKLVRVHRAAAADFATGAASRSEGHATYLQIVWPDREGRFPWEAGVAPSYLAAQPCLAPESEDQTEDSGHPNPRGREAQ